MNRNHALMDLPPGQVLWVSEKQLGVFFCGETFAFVLPERTRAAAERVARWHGCRFQFNPANGSAAFVKRGRVVSGALIAWLESVALWSGRAPSRARLTARALSSRQPVSARLLLSATGR